MRNHLKSMGIVLAVLFMFVFTACSSEGTIEETEMVITEESVIETVYFEEVEPVLTEEIVPDETVTKELAEELYIPEGIDMESTLSGEEWVASFVGNVAEPVVVIYNDNSGRKEVVQANSEVTINPDEDRIAVYWPEKGMKSIPYAISIIEVYGFDNYELNVLDAERMRSIPKRPAEITVTGGAEDWVIGFTIISE